MIVGEADIDVRADTSRVDDDLRGINVVASRAGARFGTLLGRAIGAPLGVLARRAGVQAGDDINGVASRIGDRFGTLIGRGMAGPMRAAAHREGLDGGRRYGSAFASTVKGFLTGALIVQGIRGLFHQIKAGLDEAAAGERGLSQLQAALNSTNGAVGRTAREMQALALEVQRLTGVDDDLVVAAEGILLTFTNVRDVVGQGNQVFTRAVVAARDLSVRGFGDLNATSLQLGKALNDPIKGVGALSRAGIQFTAGQRRTILTLIESNRLLDAQKLILQEVERQVGGSAVAYGKTLPGAVAITRERFANLRGEITARFIPIMLDGLGVTNKVMDSIEAHPERIDRVVTGITHTLVNIGRGLRDMLSNVADGFRSASDEIAAISRVTGLLGQSTGNGSVVQSGLGLLGTLLGSIIVIAAKVEVAILHMAAEMGKGLGQALFFVADFVRSIDHGFDRIGQGVEFVATAMGGPVLGTAVSEMRKHFDVGLGNVADDIERFAGTMMIGGAKIGAALAAGVAQGLLAQAQSDPALAQALNTILGAPVGVGISPTELNLYADGVTLRESFLSGLSSPTGQEGDATGLIDDFDKRLSEAQEAAGDRARDIGEKVTEGIKRQVAAVQKQVDSLEASRDKILSFRGSVLGAVASFSQLTDLLDDPSQATAARINRSLQNRLLGIQTFAKNLQILARRGLDKGVLSELALGGPENRAYASALVAGTAQDLASINAAERSIRGQAQLVAKVATDSQFGPGALARTNRELASANAKLAKLNKQLDAQPALIAKAVEQARKNAKVSSTTSSKTAVAS